MSLSSMTSSTKTSSPGRSTTPAFWELSPILLLVWVVVVSRVLLTRSPATRAGW